MGLFASAVARLAVSVVAFVKTVFVQCWSAVGVTSELWLNPS